jgi:cell wall-associated NlpC family hydrolase
VNTIAWLFILIGALIARQVSKGRVNNIREDLSDAFLALVSGDTTELTAVLARTGEAAEPTTADLAVYKLTEGVTEGVTTASVSIAEGVGKSFQTLQDGITGITMAAVILGEKAKGYKWTATGPDYYDCSGLVWRACQANGFTGPRFTTADIGLRKQFKKISPPGTQGPGVTVADLNDIVVWPTHHMGVITRPGMFYSARSVKTGIGESKIAGFRGSDPVYYRYVGPRKSVNPFGKK